MRYEALSGAAGPLASALGCDEVALADALGRAHSDSIGRYRRDLSAEELADVEDEAGPLLVASGY